MRAFHIYNTCDRMTPRENLGTNVQNVWFMSYHYTYLDEDYCTNSPHLLRHAALYKFKPWGQKVVALKRRGHLLAHVNPCALGNIVVIGGIVKPEPCKGVEGLQLLQQQLHRIRHPHLSGVL